MIFASFLSQVRGRLRWTFPHNPSRILCARPGTSVTLWCVPGPTILKVTCPNFHAAIFPL